MTEILYVNDVPLKPYKLENYTYDSSLILFDLVKIFIGYPFYMHQYSLSLDTNGFSYHY